ncbi:hypothetical protein ACIOC1_21940 [Streptomyces sp. NPDC088197]|uniref:hypothetical protein n=1 Tax=unclassified Streptomyces TaxID=2593676 RepID=UPI0033AE72ED
MPDLGWNIRQRAALRRSIIFTSVFVFLGLVLSIALIAMGNKGGWFLLAFILMLSGPFFYIMRVKSKSQP